KGINRDAKSEVNAARRRESRQLDGELVRIARLVACRVDAAGQPLAALAKRRLDRHAFVDAFHVSIAAVSAHQLGGLGGAREFASISVELQDAALEMIVLDPGFTAER